MFLLKQACKHTKSKEETGDNADRMVLLDCDDEMVGNMLVGLACLVEER